MHKYWVKNETLLPLKYHKQCASYDFTHSPTEGDRECIITPFSHQVIFIESNLMIYAWHDDNSI